MSYSGIILNKLLKLFFEFETYLKQKNHSTDLYEVFNIDSCEFHCNKKCCRYVNKNKIFVNFVR